MEVMKKETQIRGKWSISQFKKRIATVILATTKLTDLQTKPIQYRGNRLRCLRRETLIRGCSAADDYKAHAVAELTMP